MRPEQDGKRERKRLRKIDSRRDTDRHLVVWLKDRNKKMIQTDRQTETMKESHTEKDIQKVRNRQTT